MTSAVFILGILVGYEMDRLRTNDALQTTQMSELDAQSYSIEKEFFDTFGEYSCELASKRLGELALKLGELGYSLVAYDKQNLFRQEDYDYLLRKYFQMEIRTYALFMDTKQNCATNDTLIFYFFNPDDAISEHQGKVLDVLVKEQTHISVFSINVNYQGDLLVESVKTYYNITTTPTIILNNKITREGFTSKEELESLMKKL